MPKEPGDRIGRYVIDRRIGAGGMAEAYRAHQEGPAGFMKPVVIKVLHPWRATDEKSVAQFMREARVGARLNHTNVVQIFDVGEEDGEPFIAMEFVDGLTLLQATKRCWALGDGIDVDVAVRIIAAAALGLHHAHSLKDEGGTAVGLVHRDMSPDNIMIARDGTVKLLDFGVAKVSGADATRGADVKGKVPYMSPEQVSAADVDQRADLWGLGVTLYWCLAGRRPFAGVNELGVMRAIMEDAPPPLRAQNPAVSPALDDVVMACLERDREKRIGSAAELAERLSDLVLPTRTNPVAPFIARLLTFDDDPPERKRATGGYPAVKLEPDQTVVRTAPSLPPAESEAPTTGSGVFVARTVEDGPLDAPSSVVVALPGVDPDITEADVSATMLATVPALRRRRAATAAAALGAALIVVVVVVALALALR